MIVLVDTATPTCKVTVVHEDEVYQHEWLAERKLADGLYEYLQEVLREHNGSWDAVTGIGVLQGPGSFTGLRIGMTVLNTIASDRAIAIIGATGESWQQEALRRLKGDEDDQIVLPFYGRDATITVRRK